jgi:hypothetical protein
MLIRDYVKIEAEKDDRTHGFLDGVLRMGTAGEVPAALHGVHEAAAARPVPSPRSGTPSSR